jgi:hypothetical protein
MVWYLNQIYQSPGYVTLALILLIAWTMVWKGIALWHAGKHKQKGWFVVMFLLNTAGLLPIIYLLGFKPRKDPEQIEEVIVESVKRKAVKKPVEKKSKK